MKSWLFLGFVLTIVNSWGIDLNEFESTKLATSAVVGSSPTYTNPNVINNLNPSLGAINRNHLSLESDNKAANLTTGNNSISSVLNNKETYFNPNNNYYNKNAINNFNITDSNQTTMQAISPSLNANTSLEDKLKNNLIIPLQTSKDTNVSVGTNQIQFNIKY